MLKRPDQLSLPTISPLRGLVEVTRLLRAREDLPALLDAVARTIGESLGYRTVAVNLYRPAWDDFEVTTVYGNEEARAALLGNARPRRRLDGAPLRALRAARRLRRAERRGRLGLARAELRARRRAAPATPTPGIPRTRSSSRCATSEDLLLGIISVDEPVSGRRPDGRRPRRARRARRPRRACRRGGDARPRSRRGTSARSRSCSRCRRGSPARPSSAEILRRVCAGIRDALDFEQRLCRARRPETGAVVPQAAAGWQLEELQQRAPIDRRPGRAAARRRVPPGGLLPPHPRAGAGAARQRASRSTRPSSTAAGRGRGTGTG